MEVSLADQNPYAAFDDAADPAAQDGGPTLPGGISVQAAATGLLIVVVLAILYLFFGPTSDAPADLPTATAPAAGGPRTSTPLAGGAGGTAPAAATATLSGVPGTTPGGAGGTPVAGAAATGAAAPVASALATMPDLQPSPAPADATPAAGLAANGFVRVGNTDGFGLRLRFGPGADYATIRIVGDDEVLRVQSGPESGEGISWWRLQDGQGNIGWGAEEFLVPASPPATWNPPAASPTFESPGAAGGGQ